MRFYLGFYRPEGRLELGQQGDLTTLRSAGTLPAYCGRFNRPGSRPLRPRFSTALHP